MPTCALTVSVLLYMKQSLAMALWTCWHCNGGKINCLVNKRLLDSQQAYDFYLKFFHDPKKLRMWMIEDYPSTCPHNSGSFAFMLNIVSGWSDSSEGCCTVCFSHAAALRGVISLVTHMLAMVCERLWPIRLYSLLWSMLVILACPIRNPAITILVIQCQSTFFSFRQLAGYAIRSECMSDVIKARWTS